MKVLFFIDCFVAGGKERRLTELMKALKAKPDIQFELAVMETEIHYKEVLNLGINIHYLIRKRKKDISVFVNLYKLCKQFKPDIIHCWDSMTAIYSVPICKLCGIKLVNGMITDAPIKQNLTNKRWLRARLTFPFSSAIIGNSIAGLNAYHAPTAKSICIHNGFNFERTNDIIAGETIRRQLNINTRYMIGMVASFSKHKDYKTYFSAAELLLKKRSDITFLAIGSDTDSDAARNLIREQYREYFRLLGKISNVESFINTFDICVLSTFTEGISNSILEYMAMGKVVVASSGGGTNEIVEDKKTGFLVGPSDVHELADKIETLLDDLELRRNMGLAGRRRIEDHFSIDSMVNKFVSVYKNFNSVTNKDSKQFQISESNIE